MKYIMTQVNPDNEMRSWLISEEARVDMMLGLDVEIGTKFKIDDVVTFKYRKIRR